LIVAPRQKIRLGYRARHQFEAFHARTQRWACIVAHRRAGKTVACVMDLIDAALRCKTSEARFAYVSPTYTQSKDNCWQYLKRFTADIPGVEQRESDLMVVFPNGNRVRLYGSDNYDRLRGTYMDGLVLDEYADINPRAWPEVLRPALADRQGWAVFIGTPRGRNDFHAIHEYAERSPEWYSLVLRASQTGIVPQSELDDLRATLTPEQYQQELECSFDAAILGSYYGREIEAAEAAGRIGRVPYNPGLPTYTAWDLGIRDSTAIWFFQVSRDGVRVIDHYEASGHGLPHYAAVLNARGYSYGTEYLPHDADARQRGTGRTLRETLTSLTGRHPIVLPKQNVLDGINAARVTFASVWIDAEKCHDGLEALRAYRADYDEKRKVFTDRPRHDWASHSADAFRYLALAWRELAPPPALPKPRDTWADAFERANRDESAQGWRVA
jgi:phage terminase large subunit